MMCSMGCGVLCIYMLLVGKVKVSGIALPEKRNVYSNLACFLLVLKCKRP